MKIAQAVIEKLRVKLLGERRGSLIKKPFDNLEAYNLVLQGRYHSARLTIDALEKSLECFTAALAVDPACAQAHSGIAFVHSIRANLFATPRQVMPMAEEAARRALAIDEAVGDAHFALAVVLYAHEWNWVEAEREFRRALDLNPGDSLARGFYALLLGLVRRTDASVAEARHAVEREPVSLFARHLSALVLYLAGRFDAAIAEARAGIRSDRANHSFYWVLGWALVGLDRYDEAVEALKQATVLVPGDPVSLASLGWASGLAGDRQEALTILGELEKRRTQVYVSCFYMALTNLGLGDSEQAISCLQKAEEERDPSLSFVNTWPGINALRADPRFQALLCRMNFPETATDE